MKTLIMLVFAVILCSSCTALPAEERAFAVALCVEKDDVWRVYGRVPSYQAGGGYMTVMGSGNTLQTALSSMDTASPMRINLSQLRLLIADKKLAESNELASLLTGLSERADMCQQCSVVLTGESVKAVADALKPAAGSRLSKALELMLDARIEQGAILPAVLADVLRMGERQSSVLIALKLQGDEIMLSGGYTMTGDYISTDETALLSLLLGRAKSLQLNLTEGPSEVREASVRTFLSQDFTAARVELRLNAVSSALTEEGFERALADAMLALLTRLRDEGCDVLGLGRKAMIRMHDMAEWHGMNWPETYRRIHWETAVDVEGPA